jgi:signal transduction histidine kinase
MRYKSDYLVWVGTPVLAALVLIASYLNYRVLREEAVSEYGRLQAQIVRGMAKDLQGHLDAREVNLHQLKNLPVVQYLDPGAGRERLDSFFKQVKEKGVLQIQRIDRKGEVVYDINITGRDETPYPWQEKESFARAAKPEQRGNVFWGRPHREEWGSLKGREVVQAIVPVYEETTNPSHPVPSNRFAGSLALLVDLVYLRNSFLQATEAGARSYTCMISDAGTFVAHTRTPGIFGRSTQEVLNPNAFPEAHALFQRMTAGEAGTEVVPLRALEGEGQELQAVAYAPVKLGDQTWSILLHTPLADVIAVSWRLYAYTFFLLASLLVVVGIGAAVLIRVNRVRAQLEERAVSLERERALGEQLQQVQKMESLGLLAGGIAHDFNNILMSILENAALLKEALASGNARDANRAEVIHQSAERAADLTRKLLSFARGDLPETRPMQINALVEETLAMVKSALGSRVEVRTELHPDLAMIRGDAGQIQQALLNLCLNAKDAMADRGVLTLRTKSRTLTVPFRSGIAAGPYACLEVSDTGVGMDDATRQRIFDPFFTTKERGKGTGLGLAMVYRIVTQHGGWVEVDSRPGKGATFRLCFPADHRMEERQAGDPRRGS